MYAVIDIAEAWPGEAKAYPRTLLSYSSTGGQVLGLCSTREEAEEVLADAHDRSGLQRLFIVEIPRVRPCCECSDPVADGVRCPNCDTYRCRRCMREHWCS